MEFDYKGGEIVCRNRPVTPLDRLVLRFIKAMKFGHVIVSGYVAILFGRSRNTEDVDILIERITKKQLAQLIQDAEGLGFYPINATDADDAYSLLYEDKSSLRFAEKGEFEPNFEIKIAKSETDLYSISHPVRVRLGNGRVLVIGPLELQIAYKLRLGSDKDFEDVRHLYRLFAKNLNKRELKRFLKVLDVDDSTVLRVLNEKIS